MGTGDPDVGTVKQVLSPAEQAIYDKNVQQRTNIGDVGITGSAALKDLSLIHIYWNDWNRQDAGCL